MTQKKRSKKASSDTPSKKPPGSSGWTIEISDVALDQIGNFDRAAQKKIFKFLSRLPHPRPIGEALAGPLSGFWKYRAGDYRPVCQIVDRHLTLVVVRAGHRREAYR